MSVLKLFFYIQILAITLITNNLCIAGLSINNTGARYAKLGEIPQQVSLEYKNADYASAVIVSPHWLLTVGHFFVKKDARFVVVRSGTINRTEGGTTHSIRKVVFHPKFNYITQENDLALFQVRKPIEFFEHVKAISIAQPEDVPVVNHVYTYSGFASEKAESKSPLRLKIAETKVLSSADCNKALSKGESQLADYMFCTSGLPSSSCIADAGAPVTYLGKLIGIVATNETCANDNTPITHMKIATYHDWIDKTIKRSEKEIEKDSDDEKTTYT